MSFTTKLISNLRKYIGGERDERAKKRAPSRDMEKLLPFAEAEKCIPFTEPKIDEIFAKCYHCDRPILVSIVLLGVSHNAGVMVDCHECLKAKGIHPDYVKKYPEQAARIQGWLDDNALGHSD